MESYGRISSFVCLLLFILTGYALGNTHYVTQTGGGGAISVAQFNNLAGEYSGNTFYFSGTISTQLVINIYGSSGNPVTLDGWAGGSCNPVEDGVCTNAAVLTGGINQGRSNNAHTRHLTIQDFNITNSSLYLYWHSRHTPPEHIILRRNNFYNSKEHFLVVFH